MAQHVIEEAEVGGEMLVLIKRELLSQFLLVELRVSRAGVVLLRHSGGYVQADHGLYHRVERKCDITQLKRHAVSQSLP